MQVNRQDKEESTISYGYESSDCDDELSLSAQMLDSEKAKFEQLFNFAPVGYFILDQNGIIDELNKVALNLINQTKEKALKLPFQTFVASEDRDNFYLFLQSLVISNTKQSRDIKLALSDGQFYHTKIEGIQAETGDSNKVQHYITVTDVTEIRLAQQNLIASNQRLEMTLSASGSGKWTLDIENRKIRLDDHCYALLEITHDDFDGSFKDFIRLIHPQDRGGIWSRFSNLINTGNPIALEFSVLTHNKKVKIFALKGKVVKNTSFDQFYAGIIVDITLQRSLDQRAQRAKVEKQRLVISTTFDAQEKERQKISNALHDSVCQLLYGIKLNIQSLQATNNLVTEFQNINILIDQSISETRALSYDLTPSVLRDFGFTAGIKEIAQRFSTADFKISASVKRDADKLEPKLQLAVFRIMQELLNNSIKHSSANKVEIKICTEGDLIRLTVADNGKGFEASLDDVLRNGSGLRGIQNRLFLLEGGVKIASSTSGTTVVVTLKKDMQASDF